MPKRCGHARHTDGCMVCYWCADPGPRGEAHRKVWDEPLLVRGRCRHLGQPTGRVVDCPSCPHTPEGQARVRLKVLGCAVHGECTTRTPAEGLACCQARCPDFETDALLVNQGASGIGDALLGLTAVGGMKQANPGLRITYGVSAHARPFVDLFDGGYHGLSEHQHDFGQGNLDESLAVQLNNGQLQEDAGGCAEPRWRRYAANAGVGQVVLPTLREPDRLRGLAADLAGRVVLVPYSTEPSRNYPLVLWQALDRMLRRAGYRTLVLDNNQDRCSAFTGDKLISAPADVVTGVVLSAACVVGNDSGIAHLAGCAGAPAVALSGRMRGRNVYGLYPSVRCLQGRRVRKHGVSTVASISPSEVMLAVGRTLRPRRADGVLGMLPARPVTQALLEEQRRYLESEELYRAGAPRQIGSLLGALYEELAGQADLQALILEATYLARGQAAAVGPRDLPETH